MLGPMGKHGDITDEFDDDALRQSIETASTRGTWKNEDGFEDPKLKEIAQKLTTAPIESYAERRLRELQQRTAKKEQTLAKPAEPQRFAEEPLFRESPDEWRERVVPTTVATAPAERALPANTAAAPPSRQDSQSIPRSAAGAPLSPGTTWSEWLLPIGAAVLTFGLATTAQAAVTDWTGALGWRAATAVVAASAIWRFLEIGRVGGATTSTAVHLLAFGTTAAIGNPSYQFGLFLGALVAAIGGFAAGVASEARRAATYRPAVRTADEPPIKPC